MSVLMQLWCRVLAAALLATLAFSVCARDVQDLYTAQVAVTDRSSGELARGASAALFEVLVKLTGDREVVRGAAASTLKRRASKLLLQYAYRTGRDPGELLLAVEFDPIALASELAELNVPLWGKERPESLLWLIVDSGGMRQLLAGDEPGLLGEAALARAARRGIPLLMPLIDIEEAQHLQPQSDWDGVASTALALSSRYGTPASLVGHLVEATPGQWQVNWRSQIAGDTQEWRQQGDNAEVLIEQAVDTLADALARRYADPAMLAQNEAFTMDVYGVRSATDYARVINYLEALDTVTNAFVAGVNNTRVAIRVNARGGRAALDQSILFGTLMAPSTEQAGAYQLQR